MTTSTTARRARAQALDLLLSRLRAQALERERFGWIGLELEPTWPWPCWRHVRWPYDREVER